MKKNKKIILIVIILILLIIIGTVFYLYKFTDYLKSNQQLFWKYVVQNSEATEVFNNEEIKEIKNKKMTQSYITDSNLDVNVDGQKYNMTVHTNSNGGNSNIESEYEISKDSNSIINFYLVKKSNIVGIKLDELANGYITLKNSNLKQILEKIGIEESDNIPDNLNWADVMDLLELSDEDSSYITDKYSNFIVLDTEADNYTKEAAGIKINDVIHSTTLYKLNLSENETKKILVDLFEELSKDSRVLNLISSKMKLLNLPKEQYQISTISNKFSEIAENIDSVTTTDDEFVEISIYVEDGKMLQTNLKFYEDKLIKIVYDREKNNINIKQELLKSNNSTKFIISISDMFDTVFKSIEEININTNVSDDKNTLEMNVDVQCQNNINLNYTSKTTITDDVTENVDYDNSIKIILNDLSNTQLENLYKAVKKLLPQIYNNKKELLFGTQNNEESALESETTEESVTEAENSEETSAETEVTDDNNE